MVGSARDLFHRDSPRNLLTDIIMQMDFNGEMEIIIVMMTMVMVMKKLSPFLPRFDDKFTDR